MTQTSPERNKKHFFKASSRKDWQDVAQREWEGAPPPEIPASIPIQSYYDQSDLPDKHKLHLLTPSSGFLGARAWINMPQIAAQNDLQDNRTAREFLNSGADGILFQVSAITDPEQLLDGVELPFCFIGFRIKKGQEVFLTRFLSLIDKRKYDPATISGIILWDEFPTAGIVEQLRSSKMFHAGGISQNPKTDPSEEIASMLVSAVTQVDENIRRGTKIQHAVNAVAFSVLVGTHFFQEIAKLKALRLLWSQIAQAYGVTDSPVFIHTISEPWNEPAYDPQANLLKSTTAGMSAIFGGCDALTIVPADPENKMMVRVARNVSTILREEAHLSKVADPTAGSYYLENLTDQLAREAWQKFQHHISLA